MKIDTGLTPTQREEIAAGVHNFHWNDGPVSAQEMIERLLRGQEAVVRTARVMFPLASEAHDEPAADLLTQRMLVHEKNAWMLRSPLEV